MIHTDSFGCFFEINLWGKRDVKGRRTEGGNQRTEDKNILEFGSRGKGDSELWIWEGGRKQDSDT